MMPLVEYPTRTDDAFFSMALDEILFRKAMESGRRAVFIRFYRMSEASSTIGFSQRTSELLESLERSGRPWVRRITGGGLVHHGSDVVYSLIFPQNADARLGRASSAYCAIHQALAAALERLGFEAKVYSGAGTPETELARLACFEKPVAGDLMFKGQKIAGAAQRRSQGYVLHQGSICLDPTGADARRRLILESEMPDALSASLSERFGWPVEPGELSAETLEEARSVALAKYRERAWNVEARVSEALEKNMEVPASVSLAARTWKKTAR
jgi:lipoate-protein ligase A